MARRHSNWFTIVATDLFSGAFAAIIIIDSITPKQIGASEENQLVQISFNRGSGLCPPDGDAIVLRFVSAGETVSTLNEQFSVRQAGSECIISGVLRTFPDEVVEDPCVIVAELAGPEPARFAASITGSALSGTEVPKCV